MIRERIADDIYVFTSSLYAQVTAGAVLTKDGVILIDTLFYPDETLAVKQFIEERLKLQVKYVINTHYHADHTIGTSLFPDAHIISHKSCRDLLDSKGREGLAKMKGQYPEFETTELVLPDIVFSSGVFRIHIGGKTLELHHLPGHSPDCIGTFIVKDRILFATDNMMPVPTLFDGNYTQLVSSLNKIHSLKPDCLVQGHGEVILRGEISQSIKNNLAYLKKIHTKISQLLQKNQPRAQLDAISIESCGKSRIPLNGLVTDLHHANLQKLYDDLHAG